MDPAGLRARLLVLSETADFLYKTTDLYAPQAEGSVRWDDPAIGIDWPKLPVEFKLAEKDAKAPLLAGREVFRLSCRWPRR